MKSAAAQRNVLFLLLFGLLARYLCLAAYAHPMADDWSYAYLGMHSDLGSWLQGEYLRWNGRFFSNVLMVNGPLTLGLEHGLLVYRLVPVLLLLLTFMGLRVLLGQLPWLSPRERWFSALALLFLYLHMMPDLPEGVYWYTGAVTYQLGSILLLFHLALLIGWKRVERSILRGLGLIATALAAIGSSEVHMILVVALLAFGLIFKRLASGPRPMIPWWYVVLVLIGAAIVVLAPGNERRAAHFPERYRLFHSLGMSVAQCVRFSGRFLLDPALWLGVLLAWPIIDRIRKTEPWWLPIIQRDRLWISMLPLAVLFLCTFPAYWGTGMLGQHRTVNVALFFSLLSAPILILAWSDQTLVRTLMHHGQRLRHSWGFPVLVLIVFGLLGNGGKASRDLFLGHAARSDRDMMARYERLELAVEAGEKEVELQPVHAPESLYLLEVTPYPGYWINRLYGPYFGDRELRVVLEREGE